MIELKALISVNNTYVCSRKRIFIIIINQIKQKNMYLRKIPSADLFLKHHQLFHLTQEELYVDVFVTIAIIIQWF